MAETLKKMNEAKMEHCKEAQRTNMNMREREREIEIERDSALGWIPVISKKFEVETKFITRQ